MLLEQPVYREFLETQVTPDHRDQMASREVQDLLDQQDLKETLDLQVPVASLVILDLLDLLVQWAQMVHKEKLVSVGCLDLVEIPDQLELLDHPDHQANEDLRVTPDQRERKDLKAVVGRMVHQDNKVWSASRDRLEQ